MKAIGRTLLALAVLAVGALAWWLLRSNAPPPDTGHPVDAASLKDPALIAKGQYLATIGDCAGCHTVQGGAPFAGGRELVTPFGSIAAPNITPDRGTGLGDWRFEDFWRAMHNGVGQHGELLYPVFSYTSYTKVRRDDALAIFAYLQSVPAVQNTVPAPTLRFPYNVRNGLKAWRALYFKEGEYREDPSKSASWNRGAYLVQGLAHCNECHIARDALGGARDDAPLSGGPIPAQNWYAPDLSTQANGGLAGWNEQDIVDLLKTGKSSRGTAFGPMAEVVVRSTQHLQDSDLHGIAEYLQSLPPRPVAAEVKLPFDTKALAERGRDIYTKQCADCHGDDGKGKNGIYPPLDGNASVTEPTGANATRVVLLGGFAPSTQANPRPYSMPPFAQQLSDADVAAVVTYIRTAWSNRATIVRDRDVSGLRQTPVD
ncbi:MAG TPA: c-type cytochrome [Dyella sp.]|uniref:c-type cytochrome n=1 Tax=Dyella sp. TaxID=1869338 RepID=UPI002F92E0BD